jgi:MGT family glycosyltransferase
LKSGRFLFVVDHLLGHATAELVLAKRLIRRGHDVTVHAPSSLAAHVAGAGCDLIPHESVGPWMSPEGVPLEELIGEASRRFGSPVLAEEVKRALDERRPDVAVVDVALSAAFAAAEAAKTRTACMIPLLYQPWYFWYGRSLQHVNPARARLGLRALAAQTPETVLAQVRLILVFSAAIFDFAPSQRLDRRVKYVGRMIDPDPDLWHSQWPADDPRPLVLVTLSSLFRFQSDQVQQVLDLLGELPVRVLVLRGLTIDADGIRLPANAVGERWVPHEAVLPEASLVVTHGGHNTILAALDHGVPVLVSPLMREQAWNGERAEALGAGLMLKPDATSGDIHTALDRLLTDPRFSAKARQAAEAFACDGGDRAVDELERLLGKRWFR